MIDRVESSAGPGNEVGGMNDGAVEESLDFRVEKRFFIFILRCEIRLRYEAVLVDENGVVGGKEDISTVVELSCLGISSLKKLSLSVAVQGVQGLHVNWASK